MSFPNGMLYTTKLTTATAQLKAYAELFAATVTKINHHQSTEDKCLHFTEHLLYVDGGQYSDEQQPLARASNKMYEAAEANFL
ncbi:6098_t:CDS:2 [Paraglomus brasilianum]|uniref:6098_t:CDS:1 n=1 Tax=Paraglomus brasilianum TaxID=144538 RepID=A0A9N9FVW5_9GLOM|nr:6098_t:CDS:2 [Paraglomus brasilianum]